MASFRTTLTDDNMDLIMAIVRELDRNPSEVINILLYNPEMIASARSKLHEKQTSLQKQGKRE